MAAHNETGARIEKALASKQLLESAAKNIRNLIASARAELYSRVVDELVAHEEWQELNDRFYKTL
jgi:hypothetical protein